MTETRTLMIVDDDAAMRQMLDSLFREQGFAVSDASSAAEALDMASEVEFDAALQVVRSYLDARDAVSRSRSLVAETKAGAEPMIEALASLPVLAGPANPELSVDGEVVAALFFGQAVVGDISATSLLHFYPIPSNSGACEEDSDRGSMYVLSKGELSQAQDGICVCVRKWSIVGGGQWIYVNEPLGSGSC